MRPLQRNPKTAFLGIAAIQKAQVGLLRTHLQYCEQSSPYYKKLFKKIGIVPGRVDLQNLQDIPFTDKGSLERHNDDLLAVPPERVVDIVLSSGTTGDPTRIAYTERDLERLAYNEHQSLAACGVTSKDRVLLTCTMDRCFVAGLAYYQGARSIGAACIRNGLNSLESHAGMVKLLSPSVIVGVPSFLRKLGAYLQAKNISMRCVKRLICIGEPLRDKGMNALAVARDIEHIWKARAYSTYSSSEIVTTFCECQAQNGGHLLPELGFAEIVDDKGQRVPPGATGEIVVTPFGIEGMPLVRFRTGDISFFMDTPCSCGRNSARLGPILGRKKQMLKIKGTTVYPLAVYSALDELPEISDYYITVFSHDALSDRLTVTVSLRQACSVGRIADVLAAKLRVTPEVVVASDEEVRRVVYNVSLRKPVRFIDRR
jgi:phenylacetate-CoA ligase